MPRSYLIHLLPLTLLALACEGKDGVLTDINLQSTSGASATTGESSATTGDAPTTATTGEPAACADEPAFQASLDAWQAALAAGGPDYWYSVLRYTGGFNDLPHCDYRTYVAVSAGAVVERRFEVYQEVGDEGCAPTWIETGADVGSHEHPLAGAAVTFDALYAACCDEVFHIEPAEEYTAHFTADEADLMATCYSLAMGCGEGCDDGPYDHSLFVEQIAFGALP
ncbi:MAG: hypothetical protein JNL82_30585 [Myxococcales bacterium]|nr:hypothetical protein [Myxococcales bacterium]